MVNNGEYNRRHNGVNRAAHAMVSAVAVGGVVLGDKGKPEDTAHLNSTHVLDFAELGGDEETGGDALWETKVPSPLKAHYSAGRGSTAGGGKPATMGHVIGFGSTEEEHEVMVLGCQERGRPSDGPFDHATGKGWVKGVQGQYADAMRKRMVLRRLALRRYWSM